MGRLGLLLFTGVLLSLVVPASAEVLWDQSSTEPWGGDGNYLGTGYLEELSNKCDDFQLDEASQVTTVTFWVANYIGNVGTNTPPIRASIEFYSNYEDAGAGYPGAPGYYGTTNGTDYHVRPVGYDGSDPTASIPAGGWYTYNTGDPADYQGGNGNTGWLYKAVLETGGKGLTVTDTGLTEYRGLKIWEVTATLPVAFNAEADTHYWVAFACSDQVNSSSPADAFEVIAKNGTTLDGAYESGVGRFWGGGYDFQFVLEGNVPEPATMSLIGLGGLGLLVRRKR